MNSSLSFGQAVLTFFLCGATSCSSSWVILLVDVLPGPLRQWSFSCYMYLPSKKIYKYLPWTTAQDFFWALVWSKAPTWSWLIWQNMKSCTLISILIILLDQNQCFLLISFRFSNAFHARTNQGEISSRRFWQSEWRYCTAWWGLLRLKPERTFDNIEENLISWWIITINYYCDKPSKVKLFHNYRQNNQSSRQQRPKLCGCCFVLSWQQINIPLEGAKWLAVGSFWCSWNMWPFL